MKTRNELMLTIDQRENTKRRDETRPGDTPEFLIRRHSECGVTFRGSRPPEGSEGARPGQRAVMACKPLVISCLSSVYSGIH